MPGWKAGQPHAEPSKLAGALGLPWSRPRRRFIPTPTSPRCTPSPCNQISHTGLIRVELAVQADSQAAQARGLVGWEQVCKSVNPSVASYRHLRRPSRKLSRGPLLRPGASGPHVACLYHPSDLYGAVQYQYVRDSPSSHSHSPRSLALPGRQLDLVCFQVKSREEAQFGAGLQSINPPPTAAYCCAQLLPRFLSFFSFSFFLFFVFNPVLAASLPAVHPPALHVHTNSY